MRARLCLTTLLSLALGATALLGCGSDESDPQPAAWQLDGTITAADIPDGADLAVIWSVDTVRYKFGAGRVEGDRFEVEVPGDPPEGAQFAPGALAIATVDVLEPGAQLSDGPLDKTGDNPVGRHSAQAIIWRGDGALPASLEWVSDFPLGFSCGACVVVDDGKDRFAETACADMVIAEDGLTCDFN